jgi:periplasmic copper chaperone A
MFRTLSLATLAGLITLPALACPGFEAHDAYARSTMPNAPTGAIFMVMHNHGTVDCHLVDVQSDIAQRVELHTHRETAQGVMQMIQIEGGIPLPAGGEHVLARGGDHVMLLGLTRTLEQGATLPLTLVFADGAEVAIEVPVDHTRRPDAAQGHSHGHSHGHGHGHGTSPGN